MSSNLRLLYTNFTRYPIHRPLMLKHDYSRSVIGLVKIKPYTVHRPLLQQATASTFKLNSNSVLSSPYTDVQDFDNVLLHEYVWEEIDRWADKTAVVCAETGRSYTYAQLRKLSGRLATSLRKCKLLPGDTIAIILPNVPEYPGVVLAASEAGLHSTLVNPMYTVNEIMAQIIDANVSAIITTPMKYEDAKKCAKNNPHMKLPIIVVNVGRGPMPPGAIKFDDLVRDDIEIFTERFPIDCQDTVLLPYSSGTSGLPKGVQLTHRSLVANLHQIIHPEVYLGNATTDTHQEVVPVILPLFHIYGLIVCMFNFLKIGGKLVCVPQFTPQAFIKVIDAYRPSVLCIVPPLVQMMAQHPRITPSNTESLKLIVSGAAPLGEGSIERLQERVNASLNVIQGYGMTETSPVISLSLTSPPAACGTPVANTQVRIVDTSDENGNKNMGINEVGEIYVRGPQLMKGYLNNPKATKETISEGWLKTGDLGFYDERGFLHVQGRLKELIKVKGHQVAPTELEDLIRAYHKVQDVTVIGIPHEKHGEVPKAFIVPKPSVAIHENEIKNYVAQRVVEYKQLGAVQFIDSIPKSAAGKVLKRMLS